MTDRTQRNDFMITYGKLDYARHFAHHGDMVEREASFKRLLRDAPHAEAKHAFNSFFDHAVSLAHPDHQEDQDDYHLRYVIRMHSKHLQPEHLGKIYHAPGVNSSQRAYAVQHPQATPELLRHAISHETATIRERAAEHKNAPDDVIIKGLDDKHIDVRTAAAGRAYIKGSDWIAKHNLSGKL